MIFHFGSSAAVGGVGENELLVAVFLKGKKNNI